MKPRYEVQHYTLCEGWINCWSIINSDDSQTPQTFDSVEAAQAEIDDFFADIQAEIDEGSRAEDEGYDREEYRIVEIDSVKQIV